MKPGTIPLLIALAIVALPVVAALGVTVRDYGWPTATPAEWFLAIFTLAALVICVAVGERHVRRRQRQEKT